MEWSRQRIDSYVSENQGKIKALYITCNLTAKEVAEKIGVTYSQSWASSLHRIIGSKEMGHGGARKNAGRNQIKKQ